MRRYTVNEINQLNLWHVAQRGTQNCWHLSLIGRVKAYVLCLPHMPMITNSVSTNA